MREARLSRACYYRQKEIIDPGGSMLVTVFKLKSGIQRRKTFLMTADSCPPKNLLLKK